ncbi:type II secretion system protein M [Saccharibacillus alkalitolerans]|uniref:Type II secretion system protein M n=1 Tax=Saccharibacillus alkalitolerans TaxID=2705290 RepID=A0ABX0F9D2_9BACL|nr:type II secretion system protein M [Saccharibacillus alkalitolerans]NGZ76079.1 type II secretion system protein M [Saccharibacillus alkalitolerans]
MMERIHNNRQALVLGIAVLFLLLLVPYMLMIRPQTEDIAANEAEIARLQQENDVYQRKIDELKTVGAGELSAEQIAAKLPANPDQERIVTDLYKVGLETSVILSDASFSDENTAQASEAAQSAGSSAAGQVKSVYVTANIRGSYEGIKAWMSAIQDLPRLTSVEQFTLTKPYAFKGTLLEATVTFNASYLPQSSAAVPDPAAVPDSNGTDTSADPAP